MSDFRNHLARMLENPEFQKEYENGKAEYEVTRALVAARIEQNLTQAQLAELLGVSHYTISSYECNRSDPDDNSKIIIAKLFDVSVDYLIGLIDEPLSFNRNIRSVSLPQSFTKEECGDVLDYIKYLEFKKSKINE